MTEKKRTKPGHAMLEAKYEYLPGRWLFGTICGQAFVDIKGREFVLTPEEVKAQVVIR